MLHHFAQQHGGETWTRDLLIAFWCSNQWTFKPQATRYNVSLWPDVLSCCTLPVITQCKSFIALCLCHEANCLFLLKTTKSETHSKCYARPTVTSQTALQAPYHCALWHKCLVSGLRWTRHDGWDSNPGPSDEQSDVLSARLPSHTSGHSLHCSFSVMLRLQVFAWRKFRRLPWVDFARPNVNSWLSSATSWPEIFHCCSFRNDRWLSYK